MIKYFIFLLETFDHQLYPISVTNNIKLKELKNYAKQHECSF